MDFASYVQGLECKVPTISPAAASASLGATTVIDVRSAKERATHYIEGSHHISRDRLEFELWRHAHTSSPVVFVCQTGLRSLLATQTAISMGYRDVASLAGGLDEWLSLGLPTVTGQSQDLNAERYARHLTLPSVGIAGQGRLSKARVLIIGAGGLGSPAALYLASAGVGRLTIMDDDRVERSNLQRQILHRDDRVGWPKVASAAATLRALNPDVSIIPMMQRFNEDALACVAEHDIVLDGTDNFSSRYLINRACVHANTPYIYGSVHGMEGEVATFGGGAGRPCYACLHPSAPPPGLAPNCAEAGVLGAIPGIIGVLQAIEVLKLILGLAPDSESYLNHYDAVAGRFMRISIPRNPNCSVCGRVD